MIEGLKITIPGAEVAGLMEKRAEHHDARAVHYKAQVDLLTTAGLTEEEGNAKFSSASRNPLTDAKESLQKHLNSAKEFRFMAKWIDKTESFMLDNSDLHRLGVLSSRY